ncbi:MAG: glycine zipper 2TM domain-containing protein [Pseudomonadota bacterium]
MTNRPLLLAVLFGSVMSMAQAASPQYDSAKREAATRYAEDRAICNDERNQGQRMKCMREAKSENNRMLADAKAQYGSQGGHQGNMACLDCGKVTAVNVSEKKGESNALGMIAGGVGGALLGNQVGGGTGKKLATVAGAVGGAYAGKKIQENANTKKIWTIDVQYDNGNRASFNFDRDPQIQRGDRVKNAGQSIQRY